MVIEIYVVCCDVLKFAIDKIWGRVVKINKNCIIIVVIYELGVYKCNIYYIAEWKCSIYIILK